MVQIPASFDRANAVHRHGAVVGLARRLRRDRHRRRVGPEARLRRRLHRQGHRHRRPRSRDRHGEPAERRARDAAARRQRIPTSRRRSPPPSSPRSMRPRRTASPSSTRIRSRIPRRTGARTRCNAVRFAFYVLNEQRGHATPTARPSATSSRRTRSSSPRRCPTAAARRSPRPSRTREGLIDGVAVGEPSIELAANAALTVMRGNVTLHRRRPAAVRLLHARQPVPAVRLAVDARPDRTASPRCRLRLRALATNRCAVAEGEGLADHEHHGREQANEALDKLRRLRAGSRSRTCCTPRCTRFERDAGDRA